MNNKLILVAFLILISPVFVYADSDKVTLEKCVDGDTARFKIGRKVYSTRFLAIDTPETVKPNTPVQPFGKEASNYTCDSLKNAKEIVLEYDDNSTKEDKYGRKLAWIFVDGKLLQKKLVSKGYAKVAYLYSDYKYTEELKKVESQAKSKKLGVWSDNKNINTTTDNTISMDNILDKIFEYISKKLKSMV